MHKSYNLKQNEATFTGWGRLELWTEHELIRHQEKGEPFELFVARGFHFAEQRGLTIRQHRRKSEFPPVYKGLTRYAPVMYLRDSDPSTYSALGLHIVYGKPGIDEVFLLQHTKPDYTVDHVQNGERQGYGTYQTVEAAKVELFDLMDTRTVRMYLH